jgi:hypothetical protein
MLPGQGVGCPVNHLVAGVSIMLIPRQPEEAGTRP